MIRSMYITTAHRDKARFPSASHFTLDIPLVVKNVHAVAVRNYKFTPERVVSANNRELRLSVDGAAAVTVRIPVGDYDRSQATLLAALNTALQAHDVQVAIDAASERVQLSISGPGVVGYFSIAPCDMLQLLGYTRGVCVYRAGAAPASLPAGTLGYEAVAQASAPFYVARNSDLVVRITDIEAVLACDSVANRATAVLVAPSGAQNSGDTTATLPGALPLLQVQHRIQQLRVQLLNVQGQPYDLGGDDASFLLEFHCAADAACA